VSELPDGWDKTTLSSLVADDGLFSDGDWVESKDQDPKGSIRLLQLADIGDGVFLNKSQRFINEIKFDDLRCTELDDGDILVARMPHPLGRACLMPTLPQRCITVVDVAVIRPGSNSVSSRWLKHFLNSPDIRRTIDLLSSGTTRRRISRKNLGQIDLPVPPLQEQKRIADKLDTLLARVDACQEKLDRIPSILKRFRQAVLAAATSGQLTEDWRTNHFKESGSNNYKISGKLADFADLLDPNPSHRYPSYEGGTIPILATKQMSGLDGWDISSAKLTTFDFHEARKAAHDFLNDDIIFARKGRLGLARNPPQNSLYVFSHTVFIVRSKADKILPAYFLWFLRQEWCIEWLLLEMNSNAGVPTLGKSVMERLPVQIPDYIEQQEIVRRIENLFAFADRLEARYKNARAQVERLTPVLLAKAFRGELVPQDPNDEPASVLLERIQAEKSRMKSERQTTRIVHRSTKESPKNSMKQPSDYSEALRSTFAEMGGKADARQLFDQAGFSKDEVVQFYEALRATPEVSVAFEKHLEESPQQQSSIVNSTAKNSTAKGHFRLVEIWLEDFKNLTDYTVRFDPSHSIDIVLGWNGTGKSNLFEALVIIFRDLHEWVEQNRWPDKPMKGYRLRYQMDEQTVEVSWHPGEMKRPNLKMVIFQEGTNESYNLKSINRGKLLLPRFIFGYYSGPTNRLAEHFLPMKQAHYVRLREASSDDPATLTHLLEQRRFFCAENHHAKYVLLAFCHKEDAGISRFLEDRLRIVGFESALFVIRKPRWAKKGQTPANFWGATGIMRRVMERLRRFAIAPMVVEQTIPDGFRSNREDHYYFFLPDLKSLHAFAAEYQDARTFFLALESTDFSELIYDLKIQVRVKATNMKQVPITFHELSEGEQQLLMVLGLMRFTKSHQSLVLLDEPDTHLNPHWSVEYLKLLTRVMSEDSSESEEQQTSQILMSTHDPLVIASLFKEQIHLLKRDWKTGVCKWDQPTVNPRGLGFTGILTSEMFGMRSDLDEETLADLDNKVRLVAKEDSLSPIEVAELEKINNRLEDAGFLKAFSDPYYAAFVRAWGKRYSELMAGVRFLNPPQQEEIDRIAREVLEEAIAELQAEAVD